MADVYAQARALVRAVRESPEWQRMRKLAGPIRSDPAAEQLLASFRLKQLELQAMALQGQQPPPAEQQALQRLVTQLQERPPLRQYLEAENAYGAMLGEVQKVLAEVFQPDVPGAVGGQR
ncbi:MAG: YlbF family regulator [Bacillota bacterium]